MNNLSEFYANHIFEQYESNDHPMDQTGFENLTIIEREIRLGLIQNQAYTKAHKGFASNEIAFLSELFVEELLNAIYSDQGWHFQNLNFEKPNQPAIDLADMKNRVCFQVTITNSVSGINQKIKETLQSFFDRGMDKDFDQLFIFVASGIESPQKIKIDDQLTVNGLPVIIPETLFGSRNVLDFTSFYSVIFDGHGLKDLEQIKNVLFKIPKRPQKESYSFVPPHTYIKRRITNIHGQEIQLEEKLETEKRVTLLGVGGLGKTTELNFWANILSSNPDIFCFKVRLLDYSSTLESLLEARCRNWQNVPENCKAYFLLDGFDEVESNKMIEAANEIKSFACKYPDFRILVSCRKNFNPFEIVDSQSSEKSKDQFFTCFLDEINEDEIQSFISKQCTDPEHFRDEIKRTNFLDIFKNPYYLGNAIDIFNSKKIIPKDKADFFQQLIDLRVDFQKNKTPLSFRSFDDFELKESLKNLALTMQYAGTYKIPNTDFNQVIRKPGTRDIIERVFFNKEDNDWRFEHNNFQEFLAAQKVSEMDWNEIKKIILLNNGKLKPKWLNAFSFLVSFSENNKELINYFLGNDIESLIKVEPQKLEKEIRDQIFIKIFNRHKKEETVIWRNAYNETDLFNFGELETNPKLVDFLLRELEFEQSTSETISNALHIIAHLKCSSPYYSRLKILYLNLLKREDIHRYGASHIIIDSFSKWQFFDVETKDILISNPNSFVNDAPLGTLCRYLANGNFVDIEANIIHSFIEASSKQRVIGSEYSIYEVVKLLSVEELTRLIILEIPEKNKSRERIWIKELYALINKQAIATYYPNSPITQAIINFIYASFLYHDESYGSQFKSFFEATGRIETSFKSCFLEDIDKGTKNRRERFIVPALIANQSCLDWVVDLYSQNKIDDDIVWHFLISFSVAKNMEARAYFEGKINQITFDRFKPQPDMWGKFNKAKEEFWFKVLLNHDLAKLCIRKAFDVIGKSQTTRDEIIELQFHHEDRLSDVELITGLELISHYSDENIDREEFINRFSKNEYWNWLVLKEHSQQLSYHELPLENIEWIRNWCLEKLPTVKIKGAITSFGGQEYTYITESLLFIQFVLYLDFELSEKHLIDLISLIGFGEFYSNINGITKEYRLYDFIKKQLSIDKIKSQIMSNLDRDVLPEFILDEHIRVIEKENWTEALPLLPQYIYKESIRKYLRQYMLSLYEQFSGDSELLIPALYIIDLKSEENSFDWSLIEFMSQERNQETIAFLKTQLNVENINRFKLAVYLMEAGEELGFAVLLEVLNEKQLTLDWELLRRILGDLKVTVLDKDLLSKFLMNLLEKYIALKIDSSGFGDLLPVIFSKLFDIISFTQIDDVIFIDQIDNVLDASEKNKTQKNARYHFNEFIEKVNQHKDKSFKIADSIKELKTLGVCFEI